MNKRKQAWNAAVSAAAICVAAAMPSWAIDNPVAADYTLTEDETVDAALTVNSGVTVDLAGHKLTVKGLGTAAGTITSTVAGGVLEIDVDSGTTVNNSAVELTGGAKFTYEGEYVHCRGEAWGNGKTVNEGIPAKISLPSKATATKCWALDERGERKAEVPVEADSDGLAAISIDPKYKTVWYEISVN